MGKEIKYLELPSFEDQRGRFSKLYQKDQDLTDFHIEQVNFVKNPKKGTLRGLHYQTKEFAEAKLFRVINGRILLLAFCFDKSSNHYLNSFQFEIKENVSILIPEGYATGYVVLKENTDILYMSNQKYIPEAERGIHYKDEVLNFNLPEIKLFISEKDENWLTFGTT